MFMSPKLNQSHDYIDLKTSRGWKLLGKKVWQYKWIYLIMLLPGLAVTFVFKYLTMPGILLSWKTFVPTFGDTSLFGFLESSPWVGWQHFTRLFRESAFWTATGNTLIISLLKLVFGFPFPIILSILINELVFKKYRRVLQTVYTFPHFLSWVVLAGMAINLLGAYVHTNRLQFVEFFGKFYEGGGRPFNPFKENTKYADIKEETLS